MKAALLVLAWSMAAGASIRPYGLDTEALKAPFLDTARPRFSWKLRSDAGGDRQSAYQIQVAGAWDSGRVASGETAWIPYAGDVLQPFRRYTWRVRVWDGNGAESPWSDAAQWTQLPAEGAGWPGGWIAHPDRSLRSGPLPIFRREFPVPRPLRRAIALIAGVGFHELRVNGAKAGDHVLAPAWSNYRETVYYEALDVTALLRPGANALGILVGNGFYNVAGGRYAKFTGSFGTPRVRLMLRLEFADDSTADIVTDSSWRTTNGPITFSCIYGGEDYDARLEPAGWDRPGFDDSGWRRAAGSEPAGGTLRVQSSPPIRVQQTFRAARVSEPRPGVKVYDLGQNFAGWPRITAVGTGGAQIKLIPGELLDADGLVTQRSSGGPTYFTYTLRGGGEESWAPRFSYTGFRYVQAEGAVEALRSVSGEFVHLDAPRAGQFTTSDERLNRIRRLIDAAVSSNLQHVLTDCPHREKLGWLEQFHLMGPSLLYNWDLRAYLPKIARDMREAQTAEGLVPDIAPEYVVFGGGFRDSPEWGSTAFQLPWLAWQWYGDRAPLEATFPAMTRYRDYLESRLTGGLLTYGLGDWYDIGPKPPGYSQLTPQGVTASALYYDDLRILERTARLLKRDSEARTASEQAETLRAAFEKTFLHEGTYATGSQTSLAMPLAMGLVPESLRPAVLEKLVAEIRGRGNHTTAGDVGYRFVMRALLEGNRNDVVWDMVSQDTPPSYGAQLSAGATALTEAWDANPNSSQNHLMLGHIEEWFWAGLAGIRVEDPGLRRLTIRPLIGKGPERLDAVWETFRGPVEVHWNGAEVRVGLPPGMEAEIYLPGSAGRRVESGTTVMVAGR